MKHGYDLNQKRMTADKKRDQSRRVNFGVGFMGAVCLLLAITEGVVNFWIAFGGCALFLAVRIVLRLRMAKNDDPYSPTGYKKK